VQTRTTNLIKNLLPWFLQTYNKSLFARKILTEEEHNTTFHEGKGSNMILKIVTLMKQNSLESHFF
jgi:hypothetical protein